MTSQSESAASRPRRRSLVGWLSFSSGLDRAPATSDDLLALPIAGPLRPGVAGVVPLPPPAFVFDRLLFHAPLLLVLLPLVGIWMIGLFRRQPARTLCGIALTNLLLSLSLAVAMVGHYDGHFRSPGGRPIVTQMRSSLEWPVSIMPASAAPGSAQPDSARSPAHDSDSRAEERTATKMPPGQARRVHPAAVAVRLDCGVDGLTAWLVLAVIVTCWTAAVRITTTDAVRSVPGRAAEAWMLLLATESAAVAYFAARDLVLLVLASGTVSLLLGRLAARLSSAAAEPAARTWTIWQAAGDLLLTAGAAMILSAQAQMQQVLGELAGSGNFDVDLLTFGMASAGMREPASLIWRPVEGRLLAVLALAVIVKGSWFPFHQRLVHDATSWPAGVGTLLLVIPWLTSGYLWMRFSLPLFIQWLPTGAIWLIGWGLIGLATAAASESLEVDVRRRGAWLAVAATGLIPLGGLSLSSSAVTGSWLWLVAAAAGFAALLTLAELGREGVLLPRFLQVGLLLAVAVGCFPSLWLVLLGMGQNPGLLPGGMLFGVPAAIGLLAWWLLLAARWAVQATRAEGSDPPVMPGDGPDSVTRPALAVGLIAVAPAMVLLVALGLDPGLAVSRLEPTVARHLRLTIPAARPGAIEASGNMPPADPVPQP